VGLIVPDEVCEHCLIGIFLTSMMGRFRVYECEMGIHDKDFLAGFTEPCVNYLPCRTERRVLKSYNQGKDKEWGYEYKFKYKRIPIAEMRKSKDCIRQEQEEEAARKKEAEELSAKAMDLLRRADTLEHQKD
jgi:hypothetical protein